MRNGKIVFLSIRESMVPEFSTFDKFSNVCRNVDTSFWIPADAKMAGL